MSMVSARWQALHDALEHCARNVPLYRGIAGPDPELPVEASAREALVRFPVLTKERLVRAFPHGFVPEGRSLGAALKAREVAFVGTSGTTGERVQVLWHQPWWDAQERDGFRAHSLTRELVARDDYREAVLTTPVCSGNLCHVGRTPMQDRVDEGRTLFLNQTPDPAAWSDDEVSRMADELEAFRPVALEADPAYLAYFCARLRGLGRSVRAPHFIDLSYEFPSAAHARSIARTFDVPVLDAYGSTECGFVFFQCDAGRYHHNAEWSHAEVVPCAARTGLSGIGRLLVTPVRNPWLNLVRFDTGDLVRVGAAACPCGRAGELVLDAIEGRQKDLLVAAGGGLVTVRAIDRALAAVAGILNYRLTQRAEGRAELELVPDPELEPDPGAAAAAVEGVLGFAVRTRVVPSVPVEASGKFRLCAATHVDATALSMGSS
jgi:phenylacetate-coenzyme A ligase PaaK-like adenylate-forming protein